METKWISTPVADESELKTAFAYELLRTPTEPFKAALAVFPDDTSKALKVANYWPTDSFVRVELDRLKDEQGELAFLPTKADLARLIWERAQSQNTSNEDLAKLGKLYAEIMNFVPKASVAAVGSDGKGNATIQVIASPLDEQL